MGMLLSGCGGGNDDAGSDNGFGEETSPAAPERLYDQSEVVAHIGATPTDYDTYEVFTADGVACEAVLFLLGKGEVSLYADAGDNVAANPDRTVGVKISAEEERTCNEEFTKRLSTFPDGEPYSGPAAPTASEAVPEEPSPEATEGAGEPTEPPLGGIEGGDAQPLVELKNAEDIADALGCELVGATNTSSETEYECGTYTIVDFGTDPEATEQTMFENIDLFTEAYGGDFTAPVSMILLFGTPADIAKANKVFYG